VTAFQLDSVLGNDLVLAKDTAEAVREIRDDQDARDAARAEEHS
jgi:hypothetical protein